MKAFLINYFSKRLGKIPRVNPLQFYQASLASPFSISAYSKTVKRDPAHLFDSQVPDREGWLDIYGHSMITPELPDASLYAPLPEETDIQNVLIFLDKTDYESSKKLVEAKMPPHPMTVDDIMDMFNENYDDLEKKIGPKKIAEIKPEIAAARLLGKNIRFGTCAPALISKTHGKHLLQELANRLGVYIIGATHLTHSIAKKGAVPDGQQKGHVYVNPYFGDWVLYRPGGDPFADKPYRVLGYRDELNTQLTKDGDVVLQPDINPSEQWLNICTDHAEELIAQDEAEERKAKMNMIINSFSGLDDYTDYVFAPDPSEIDVKVEPASEKSDNPKSKESK